MTRYGQPNLDFSKVSASALALLPAILRRLLPDGRIRGREYIALNPTRPDRHFGSFSVNIATGAWADFATGDKGGDLISLVAYLRNQTQVQAAGMIADMISPAQHFEAVDTMSQAGDSHKEAIERTGIAQYLWQRRRPVLGTPAERYLRGRRAYRGPIPPTIAFLPGTGRQPPSMIAAFGVAQEFAPGDVEIAVEDVAGVHLTRLLADGSGKAGDPSKIMIGRSLGAPIVLAPPNDLLGLIVVEGIETGLSLLDATGLGVWVAGSASRMSSLAKAIPEWIDCVSIDAESDDAGKRNAAALARGLEARGIRTEVRSIGNAAEAAL